MMVNRQKFKEQEAGAYLHHNDAQQRQQLQPDRPRMPQQFGLDYSSSHSVLRKSPPSALSTRSLPASFSGNVRSPIGKQPLVLDASASSPAPAPAATAAPASSTALPRHNFLRSIWKDRQQHGAPQHQQQNQTYPVSFAASSISSNDSLRSGQGAASISRHGNQPQHQLLPHSVDGATVTASALALDESSSARAGFLQKLGQNVPVWKRRFFVLEKPRACLYYFLSPHDTAPRGCLDLEGAHVYVPSLSSSSFEDDDKNETNRVDEISSEKEGNASNTSPSWKIELYWPDTGKCVQLEARSQQSRDEWIQALQSHQYAAVEHQLRQAQHRASACASRISELERQVQDYRLVEQELQVSQVEAKTYKSRFEELDSALRKLQTLLRRNSEEDAAATKLAESEPPRPAESIGESPLDANEETSEGASGQISVKNDCEEPASSQMRDSSLLDASIVQEGDSLDPFSIPGAYFAGLYNVCEQLRQAVRLSQVEASQAVADCRDAQLNAEVLEKRMHKAEKHLCKLWEENCGLRKVLKQKKRERQVLVREVKALREEAATRRLERRSPDGHSRNLTDSNTATEDEEQLLNELEAHVLSSIKLHEQLLGSPLKVSAALGMPMASASLLDHVASNQSTKQINSAQTESRSASVATTASGTSASVATFNPAADHSKGQPVASLLDDFSDTEDEEDDLSSTPSISSVKVEAESLGEPRSVNAEVAPSEQRTNAKVPTATPSAASSVASTPERPNPLHQLDEISVSTQDTPRHLSDETGAKKAANRVEATSQLQCPFADVVTTRTSDRNAAANSGPPEEDELHVYHLTFYSRKIGLQFQKVPPPPAKAAGLLTAAVAADLRGASNAGGNKTASELRRIAIISSQAKSEEDRHAENDVCQVAKPVDAVIVCGFIGFDDTGTNVRPRLGARLVAFDGVSVEVGKWTFDSIRKSIQARGRPLTLSFRNDYLTTEQRAILTKALSEVESSHRPPQLTLQYSTVHRPPSCDPSVQSALSHESSTFVNSLAVKNVPDDEMSGISVRSGSSTADQFRSPFPQSFSGARSTASSSGNRERRYTFRSFSEAGSSTSMISSVAPLVSSLLYRNSMDPFTPDYLLRKPEPVENKPQHQDFQSELL